MPLLFVPTLPSLTVFAKGYWAGCWRWRMSVASSVAFIVFEHFLFCGVERCYYSAGLISPLVVPE